MRPHANAQSVVQFYVLMELAEITRCEGRAERRRTGTSAKGGKTSIDVKGLMTPEPKQQDVPAKDGYNADQRKNLERLIDGTGSNQ